MKIGDHVDDYVLLKELGHGGMGGVWIAFDPKNDDLVAVKTIFEELAKDEMVVRRFQREVDVLRKLDHPNIVGFRGNGSTDRTYYLALEYIRGLDLADLIQEQGRMSVPETLNVVCGLARAIQHAHEKGVIHRDIKPSNIMLTKEGRIAKVLDFGVAYAEDSHLMTKTGDVVGTFMYSSPEQNQGKQVDERSDLYALGLTFYELLTGVRALRGATLPEVTSLQLTAAIPPPSERNSGVPEELDTIVLKLLKHNTNDRYQSAEELLFDLEMFQNDPATLGEERRSIYEYPEHVAEFKEAQTALRLENYDAVVDLAERLAAKAPRAAELYHMKGQANWRKGAQFPAINDFKRAIAFDRGNIGYHMELADLYREMGMVGLARDVYTTVLEMEPNSTLARRGLEELKSGTTEPAKPISSGRGTLASTNEDLNSGFMRNRDRRRLSLGDLNENDASRTSSDEEDLQLRETVQAESLPDTQDLTEEKRFQIQERLQQALPRTADPYKVAGGTFLFWGLSALRRRDLKSALQLLGLEALLVGLTVNLRAIEYWVPPDFLGEGMAQWAANPANQDLVRYWGPRVPALLFLVIGVWIALETYQELRHRNLQAYVVEVKSGENNIIANAGALAGFHKGDKVRIYQEATSGMGVGVPIGDAEIIELLPERMVCRYRSGSQRLVKLGDLVVSTESVKEGWLDPTKKGRARFPNVES